MGISKILLIDESEHSTEKLKPALETRNREVCVIRSKEELLEHLKSYPTYDVILVEKDLPKMKKDKRRFDIGIEIAEMMKNRYPLAQVILFVSDEKDIIPSTLFDVVQRQSEEIIGAQIEQATLSALESQLDSAESQLSQINQIASALLSGRDLEDICRILVEGIAALNFDRVQLYLLDEAGFELRAFAEIGMMPNEAFSDRKWPLELLEYLHPTRIPDQPILHRRGADGGLLDHEAYIGRKSVDEWVSLPLTVDGELIGKISADTKYSGRQLCEKELDPLMGIARQGAIAIQKYRLQAKEREKNKILKVIHNVVSEVRGSVSPETVFATASKAAVELFPEVDHSALLLFERGNKYCEVVSEFPAEVGALGLRFMPQALGFEVEDLKRDGYVEIKDIAAESRLGPAQIEILEKNIRSALLYPLKNNSTVLGFVALNTLNRLRPRAIRPDLLELIDIFASNVSTAVINAQQIATVRSLNDIARALAVIKDKTEMLETIVTHAVKIVNGRYGGIEWINYDKGCIEVIADSYLNGTLVNCFPIEAGMAGYMLAERETCLHTESYADEPYAYQPFTEIGFEALVEVMLIQDDKPIGFLFVEDAQGRRFTRQDVENLQAFADHALVAIEQAELMESREQLSNQLHALHVIGDQIEGAKEVDEIIEYALFGLVSHHGLHYDRVAFFLIDPKDPNRLYGKGAYGFLDEKEWRAVDGNEEPSDYDSVNAQAKVFQIAQYYADTPLHKRIQGIDLNLADEDCHYLVTQILNPNRDTWYRDDNDGRRIAQCPEPIRTLFSDPGPRMIVSMAVEDRRIGFLIIDNPFSLREIPPAKRRALKTFVTSITVAIKNRYLISETKRRAEYQEILLNTGGAFANNTTAEETIRIILDKLKELIHAPIIKFVRINLEHVSRPNLWAPRLIYGAQAGNRPVADWVKRSGESIRVLESGQYLMVPEIEKSTHWLPHAAETLKMKSCVCFPAIVGENPVGVVWVYFDQIRIFAHEELQDWQIFVNQAASIYVQASSIDKLTMEQHLSRSAQEMVSINDIGSVFATVVRQASQALNENKVTVALYGYDRERQTLTEMDTFPPEDQALMRKVDLAERTRTVETILNAGEPIDFSFPAADPEIEKLVEGVSWHPLLPEKPYEAISIMPLIRHGQHLGVMAIGYEMPQRFTQSQTGSLRRLAHFAEVALANALALRGKEREIRRFNLLSKVNQSVSPDDTAAELVYHSLIRSIYDYMLEQGKDIVYCELRLRQGDFLKTSVVYPPLKAVSDREIYLNAVEKELGIAGNTFLSGKTTVIHDVDDEETYIRLFDETRSEICVPVIYEDLPLGILNLEFRQKNILDHNDVELLKAVASRFAGLIRKFHQEWQRRAFHQASQVIARAVIDNYEEQTAEILKQVVEVLKPLNGAQSRLATIHAYQPDSHEVRIEAVYPPQFNANISSSLMRTLDRDGDEPFGITGRTMINNESYIVPDVSQDPDYLEINAKTRSEMTVPLIDEGRVVGAISVQSEQVNAFMKEDQRALITFAELMVIVRKNGRMYSQLLDARHRVESAIALSRVQLISATWQHANRGRAITIRDRAELLDLDLKAGIFSDMAEHASMINELAKEIIRQPMTPDISEVQSVEPQSIQEILLEYFSSLERAKQWAPVRIQLDLAEDQSTLVRVQKDWIYAMLEILMNNLRQALANRPDPHCFIQSSPVFSQNKMVVTMTDNGPGFSSQVIKSIFKRPIKKRRTESGAGIGLLIARLIVETYGGKISGKNVEGGGAMIKIELPFDDLVYLSNGSGPIDLN